MFDGNLGIELYLKIESYINKLNKQEQAVKYMVFTEAESSSKQTKNMDLGQTPNTAIMGFYLNTFWRLTWQRIVYSLWKDV